ncbi:hypothetical protein DesLBE_1050 [Desulfitobacterium sp. LBE]|uniref:hypothetical protein n=1 Tax=Desulfitobacterium sp. LBE TaxID=884086 RepID=UPI00119B1936|nr:hypothetical protein [Desulfitobacterium sp. LBE]TWH56798.1 hypothetical protein DesLBE_1050 [Desulfitobacterium sp. LBE]
MKKQFAYTLMIILVTVSALLLSLINNHGKGAVSDSVHRLPAYHIMPCRAEFVMLFYETQERVGFRMLDGIFLYNYQEDRLEADFALSEGCFEPEYAICPWMSTDEKGIIIGGLDVTHGIWSSHYYRYDIMNQKMVRINGDVTEVAKFPDPGEDRRIEAFSAKSWAVEDLRYNPVGSDKIYIPFKAEEIPTMAYEMQNRDSDIPIAPRVTLMPDGRFQFTYSLLSSYINFGQYNINGAEYTMVTKDGRYTFVFYKEGDSFVFNAERSARCIFDDGTELADGTVFLKTRNQVPQKVR